IGYNNTWHNVSYGINYSYTLNADNSQDEDDDTEDSNDQQISMADLEARGALPLAAFREAQESAERLQVWARETLGDLAPDFSRL
ncbi:hypothetical protein MJN54_33950, partial [Salmonella enterica subsp. enterica serovar Kentucky]|nr:hypothetical protein [Salmonella enterica subsp. enterica serovar Kentucky]